MVEKGEFHSPHCTEAVGSRRLCGFKASFPLFFLGDEREPIYTCLINIVEPWALQYLEWFRYYKNGYLLRAGGLEDQPYLYLKAMAIIDAAVSRAQAEKMQEQRQNMGFRLDR